MDGTRWNLPNTADNRLHFGSATNQHAAVGCAQAQGSVLYDVLNDIGLNAVLAFWAGHQRKFVLRLPRGSFKAARDFMRGKAQEKVVTLHVTPDQRAWLDEQKLPVTVRVRLVKITLKTGEILLRATSLLDVKRYDRKALDQLYA